MSTANISKKIFKRKLEKFKRNDGKKKAKKAEEEGFEVGAVKIGIDVGIENKMEEDKKEKEESPPPTKVLYYKIYWINDYLLNKKL
jgi:hypothetical protein